MGAGTHMKVYFGFTVAGDRSTAQHARRMVDLLESMGHEVLTRHLVAENAREMDRTLTPQAVFRRDMDWLDQADIFIAEVSGSSFGIGYETGFVLGATQKKCLLFYRHEAAARISLLIVGNEHPNCTLAPYSAPEEMEARLRALMQPETAVSRLQC